MRLKSHLHIANITCEMIQEITTIKLNRKYVRLGAIMPDILPNRRYELHSPNSVYKHYEKELKRIICAKNPLLTFFQIYLGKFESLQSKQFFLFNKKKSKRISFIIGLLIHYITDAFCLSHNIYIYNLKKHIQYEHLLDDFKYDYEIPEDIINTIKEYMIYLEKDNITIKNYIEEMNVKYIESINEHSWENNIKNDIENSIIHGVSIICNFLIELRENKITAFS
jgi:hypothetical protein